MRKIGGYTYNGEIRLFGIEEILVIFTSFIYIYLFFSFFFVLPFVQIPFRVLYNCLYIFFFSLHFINFIHYILYIFHSTSFSFSFFLFLTIHIPFTSSLSRDSRFSLFHLLSFIIPFSFFLSPPPPPPFCGVHARQREFTYTQTYSWRLELALRDPGVIYLSQDDRYRLACSR